MHYYVTTPSLLCLQSLHPFIFFPIASTLVLHHYIAQCAYTYLILYCLLSNVHSSVLVCAESGRDAARYNNNYNDDEDDDDDDVTL